MIRKIFLFAAFLFSLGIANAQSVGEWNVFTRFSGNVDDVIETSDKVYYTSGNRLFSYDKKSDETFAYTTKNKLNDTNVSVVRYNPDGKYLFIGYDNGNMDFLYDNGRVVNMSDIKDATLTYTKGINSVIFANNRAYVGTEFGIIIIDDQKHQIVESGIYGSSIQSVFPVGDYLILQVRANDPSIYYAPLNGHHNTFSKFTRYTSMKSTWMQPVGDKSFVYADENDGGKLKRYTFKFANGLPEWGGQDTYEYVPNSKFVLTSNGNYVTTSSEIVYIDDEGAPSTVIELPSGLSNQKIATYSGAKSVWGADADGIGQYSIGDDGTLTVLSEKSKPEGIVTDEVFFIRFDDFGGVWLGNLGVSQNLPVSLGQGDFAEIVQATTRIKNGKIEDMNVYDATVNVNWSKNYQTWLNNKRLYGGCTGFAVDPIYPNRYYQGNNMEGLYVIEDNHQLISFSTFNKNFPSIANGGWNRVGDVKFDKEGNLWFCASIPTNSTLSTVWVLPKETLRGKELTEITATDWLPSKHAGIDKGHKDFRIYLCKKSDVLFSWHHGDPLEVLLTKGTWSNPNDDEFFQLRNPLDQDSKVWNPAFINCVVEDHKGKVWVGASSGGVIEIANPNGLTQQSQITRIKVPRNDGTNYADYLCESEIVYGIAVDNSNRKWIATDASGVYLVSENGDQILEHFTMDNSPLPTNQVISVACDPNSNTVYFGLTTGLVSYNSTSSPSAPDYSEVYAYPNPVKPDYTGYITITGLMDNSLVKITDASGNVVHQTRSEGGMAVWDGFDGNHNRVKTGVYYVFASQGADGGSNGAVTKIMVVR